MNPLNRMNPGAVTTCNCEPVDRTLTCNGQHGPFDPDALGQKLNAAWRGDAVSAYPKELTQPNYSCSLGDDCTRTLTCKGLHTATKPTICTGPETCKDPSHDQPYTGNGYSVAINPLLEEPATIDEHVLLIRARGVSLERWIRKPEDIGTNGPIIREIIARMEGDLQSLRTLVKDIEKAESEPTAFENLCETMPELAERVRSIGKAGE